MGKCPPSQYEGVRRNWIRMAASPGFSVFFFRVIFKYTATSKFDSRVACTGAAAFLHGRRISVYRACTLDEPARVVKPHRKHAQNTTGEVRGEFQRRRVCACCRSRKTLGASAAAGRFYPKRHPRLLLSLVDTTITVDSIAYSQRGCVRFSRFAATSPF